MFLRKRKRISIRCSKEIYMAYICAILKILLILLSLRIIKFLEELLFAKGNSKITKSES